MDLLEAIRQGRRDKLPFHKIARKIYFSYPSYAFVGEEERQYLIFDKVAEYFDVPITSVQVAGSAKTGHSFHKGTCFIPGSSDLDIAIIDARLFVKYMDVVCSTTRNYTDLTNFEKKGGVSGLDKYLNYLSKGIFRPDLMPSGPERSKVNDFFGSLSAQHGDLFSSINAAIYLSGSFFERKQRSAITNFFKREVF
ncbi:hypothetical protein [Pseudomonas cichorii]|uniref:hypothetical protein n=1 Tax=Pseudomonas cichorii TaxID=36746 RepID=UPI001C89ADB2|nr:hypothetical protein [Pseudomonas cichorii]MBX8497210.1 hypothetical protein [Pseudomonas cichorii]